MPHRTDPDAPTDWHAQELLLMREVMKLVGRSLGLTRRQFSYRLRKAGMR